MEELLKREVEGCDEIMFYDARIRQAGDEGSRINGLSHNPFARQVHTDNTASSCIAKIHNLTDMKADYLLSGRCRIINIWRPIKHPVYDCSLAVIDGGKLSEGDIIECDRHRADTGLFWDTMGVAKYRSGYHWYYMSEQAEEDVLLFKNFDSATDVEATTCLHSAFDLPAQDIPPGAPTRESIEVRALIFTYPKGISPPPNIGTIPHPLAITLEENRLGQFYDDQPSISTQYRTDIDEGAEIKDAVLLLRRQEIKKLEREREQLLDAVESLQSIVKTHTRQLEHNQRDSARKEYLINDQAQRIEDLEGELCRPQNARHHKQSHAQQDQIYPELRRQLATTQKQLIDVQNERTVLLQSNAKWQAESWKWKSEAMGKGNEAVSSSWQWSVDEAVKRERAKDSLVIASLRQDIERLRTGNGAGHQ